MAFAAPAERLYPALNTPRFFIGFAAQHSPGFALAALLIYPCNRLARRHPSANAKEVFRRCRWEWRLGGAIVGGVLQGAFIHIVGAMIWLRCCRPILDRRPEESPPSAS